MHNFQEMTQTQLVHAACDLSMPGHGFVPIDVDELSTEVRTAIAPFIKDGGVPAWRLMLVYLKRAAEKD